ncbi:MAG: exodeoxyribonuclease VII large subunit [Anaerolineaceae bacterium]|nr:exodeoxyribonuclease VII large subunit [Anaerolineaceae bacterium]
MFQPPLAASFSLTVTELTRYLRQLFESDEILQDVWVYGEISNLNRHTSGHVYFTIKDSGASLRCVIWKSQAARIQLAIQNGMAIEAHGSVGIYEPRGEYQLYVSTLRPAGEGQLYQEFIRLKARLESEGYFDEEHKTPLPPFPQKIGVVTSRTGAALQDILNTLHKRYRLAKVILAPATVQGVDAPLEIARAIQRLNDFENPDVILLARGGGSLEDLWAFNDERVVKAIYNSNAPVVTGVGHETDFTLADFAADLRAPTPTAAAVLATPDSSDLAASLNALQLRLDNQFQNNCSSRREKLNMLSRQLHQNSPLWQIQNNRQHLDELTARSYRSLIGNLHLHLARHQGMVQRLELLNPIATLQRGYAIVTGENGKIISTTNQVSINTPIQVQVSDGTFKAKVTKTDHPPQ